MKLATRCFGAGMACALAACATQDGALIHVTFDAGSIDHVEFIFARAATEIKIDLSPQMAVDSNTTQRAYLRDYSAADSVTIGADATTYDYLVPSNVAPAAEELFVVGYQGDKPVRIAHLTPHAPSDRVNRYTAALVADVDNLDAFGVDPHNCVAWKHGKTIDAITLLDDHDCDGRSTNDEPRCDVQVLDRDAPMMEACDGRDSGGDCTLFSEPGGGLCKVADTSTGVCFLRSGYGCSETGGGVMNSLCEGPPPQTTAQTPNAICLDPNVCSTQSAPPFDLAAATPDFNCNVLFAADSDARSCNKFRITAALISGNCPAADYIDDGSVKIQRVSNAPGGCVYSGEVLMRTPGQMDKNIALMYPTGGDASVRRLSVLKLTFKTMSGCTSSTPDLQCVPVHPTNAGLLQTCGAL